MQGRVCRSEHAGVNMQKAEKRKTKSPMGPEPGPRGRGRREGGGGGGGWLMEFFFIGANEELMELAEGAC